MTPGPTGEPQPAGGQTVPPRATFWCAVSVWVLTPATTATVLIYNHVHPALFGPRRRAICRYLSAPRPNG
jgi:hypothetical protein